jgi:hypothetical protein
VSSESFTSEQALTLLAEEPARIATLAAGLTPVQLRAAPGPDEWSANDVLAHLRSCADVWGDSMRRILAEDGPTIRAVSPRTWMHQTDYPDLEFQPSLRAFSAQRADLLAMLKSLSPSDWTRTATLIGAGRPLQPTVLSYAERMAVHERTHIKQIARIVETMRA